jgi:exopolysaccharide biosynthesis polyprenyl glycosylphosphotransferase
LRLAGRSAAEVNHAIADRASTLAGARVDLLTEHPTNTRVLRWGIRPFLVAGDLLAVTLAGVAVRSSPITVLLVAISFVGLYALGGLYRSRLTLSVLDDVPSLVARGLVAGAVVTTGDLLLGGRPLRDSVLATAGLAILLAFIGRGFSYSVVRSVRRAGLISHNALVVGAGRIGGQLVSLLLDHRECGLRPVGFLDSDPLLAEHEMRVPLLGGYSALARVVEEQRVAAVIVAFGTERERRMVDVLRALHRLECEIFFVPRLFEMHSAGGQSVDSLWGLPLVRMKRAPYRSSAWQLKRFLDVVVAGLALVLLSPLFAAIALAVRFHGGRGVLFRQERVGVDGRRFAVLKFRTLTPATAEESATAWSIAGDRRLGRVGRFLRRTSLDELPQLWNVLVGDMSIVGPRPERPHFVDQFKQAFPHYIHRHRVPAGLTGWAQVHGLRGDTSIQDRARFDNYYVENWSLWLDVKIMLRTVASFLRGAA